jgi:aminoglycoside/choline kinase family phosphotransferase
MQYDLASLLIDPYVTLSAEIQSSLLTYCVEALVSDAGVEADRFLAGYGYLKIARNLQMLGAFGYLSRVKGKIGFANYIPSALETLINGLGRSPGRTFPKLKAAAEKSYEAAAKKQHSR